MSYCMHHCSFCIDSSPVIFSCHSAVGHLSSPAVSFTKYTTRTKLDGDLLQCCSGFTLLSSHVYLQGDSLAPQLAGGRTLQNIPTDQTK